MVINSYVDVVMEKLLKRIGIELPNYTTDDDPTKMSDVDGMEWTIPGEQVKEIEKIYNAKVKGTKKRKPFTLDWDGIAFKKEKKEEKPAKAEKAV